MGVRSSLEGGEGGFCGTILGVSLGRGLWEGGGEGGRGYFGWSLGVLREREEGSLVSQVLVWFGLVDLPVLLGFGSSCCFLGFGFLGLGFLGFPLGFSFLGGFPFWEGRRKGPFWVRGEGRERGRVPISSLRGGVTFWEGFPFWEERRGRGSLFGRVSFSGGEEGGSLLGGGKEGGGGSLLG